MRLDLFLKKTGLVKRRTVAQNLIRGGLITLNGKSTKSGKEVKVGDIIGIKGECYIVKEIPHGNVKKNDRERYVERLNDCDHTG